MQQRYKNTYDVTNNVKIIEKQLFTHVHTKAKTILSKYAKYGEKKMFINKESTKYTTENGNRISDVRSHC